MVERTQRVLTPSLILLSLKTAKGTVGPRVVELTLVHFGAVVADAPSPLSTPRSRMRGRSLSPALLVGQRDVRSGSRLMERKAHTVLLCDKTS